MMGSSDRVSAGAHGISQLPAPEGPQQAINGIWCGEAPDISTKPHKKRRHAPQLLSMAEPPLQTWSKAAAYLDLSPSLLDREGAEGRIPFPVPVAATLKGWVGDDLDAWIDDERSAQAATITPWDAA